MAPWLGDLLLALVMVPAPGDVTVEVRVEGRDGEWFEAPSGAVTYRVMNSTRRGSSSRGELEWSAVDSGRFVIDLEADERCTIQSLEFDGGPALLAADAPELMVTDSSTLRLSARYARPVTVEVVAAENGEPLRNVQFVDSQRGALFSSVGALRYESWRWQPESLWPLPSARAMDASAPLLLAPTREELQSGRARQRLSIGAPGRVWATLDVDWFVGGRARVELVRGGALSISVTGIGSDREVERRLASARAPASPAIPTVTAWWSLDAFESFTAPLLLTLKTPLDPGALDPLDLEVEGELAWQATLSEAEVAALFSDGSLASESQLREHLSWQHSLLFDSTLTAVAPLPVDGVTELEHLPPGRYRLAVAPGDGDVARPALDEVEVVVVAGETTSITLPLLLPTDGPFVPLVGTVRWPTGTTLESFEFWWEPIGDEESPRPHRRNGPLTIPAHPHGSAADGALEAWREVRLGAVRPGRWRVSEPKLGVSWDLEISDSESQPDAKRFELIVPELADLEVTLVDAATGGPPAEVLTLLRRPDAPFVPFRSFAGDLLSDVRFSGVERPLDRNDRTHLVTAAGPVRFDVVSNHWESLAIVNGDERWLEPGANKLTLAVGRPTIIAVEWQPAAPDVTAQLDFDAEPDELDRALRRARLVPLDPEGPPIYADWQRWRAGWFRVPTFGRYRLELVPPPGIAPIPPRIVEARAGEVVQVSIERSR